MLIFSQQEDLLHKVIDPVLIKLSLLLREQTEISLFNLCDRALPKRYLLVKSQ